MAIGHNLKIREIRSISMPSRSHPITLKIDEEILKLKGCESSLSLPTASTISSDLLQLEIVYKCTYDLLNLTSTQQVVSRYKSERWVDEFLDGSVRLLDSCDGINDLVSRLKETILDIRSCIRRQKKDSDIESCIVRFISFRKKMKKEAKSLITSLKKTDIGIAQDSRISNLDDYMKSVIRVLREVNATTILIFQSLLVFLSVSETNQTKWSLVSSLMRKGKVTCEGQLQKTNELESVEASLSDLRKNRSNETKKTGVSQDRLKTLEDHVEELEGHMKLIFKQLIRTRASFLNILSY